MRKLLFLIIICNQFSCNFKKSPQNSTETKSDAQTSIITTPSIAQNIEVKVDDYEKIDSLELRKIHAQIRATSWYLETKKKHKISIFNWVVPQQADGYYYFNVSSNQEPDLIQTEHRFATKRGEWILLDYDIVKDKVSPINLNGN